MNKRLFHTIITLIILAYGAAACSPAPRPVATTTPPPQPTATATLIPQPTATATPIPTAIPTATATTSPEPTATRIPVKAPFKLPNDFKTYERQFPSGKYAKTDSYFFRCVLDLNSVKYGKVQLPGGLELTAWQDCYFSDRSGVIEKASVALLLNDPAHKQHLLVYRMDGVEEGIVPDVVAKTLIPKVIRTVTNGRDGVQIMGFAIGPVSQGMGKEGLFLKNTVNQIYPDKLSAFLTEGKTETLPEISEVGRLLIPHRVFADLVQ